MRSVRDRADARWMPSRYHFALFRLLAFLRLRGAAPQPRKGMLLIADRDQTAWEHYLVAAWYIVTMAAFLAELFSISILFALPIAMLVPYLLLIIAGLPLIRRDNIDLQSFVFMAAVTGAAAYYSFSQAAVRFVAWQFLGFLVFNTICAAIVFLLRDNIARLEASRFGV